MTVRIEDGFRGGVGSISKDVEETVLLVSGQQGGFVFVFDSFVYKMEQSFDLLPTQGIEVVP